MHAPVFTGERVNARMGAAPCPAPRRGTPERSQFHALVARERGPREPGEKCAAPCTRGRSSGFTYIGLLILVAVMSLSMTVVAEVWQSTQQRDKEEELLFIGNEFRRAIGAYVTIVGAYPKSLEDLVKDPGFPGVRRYLRRIYRDPMTGRAEWGLQKPDGNLITGVYSLSEAEPRKQSGFNLADLSFVGKKKYSEWVFLSSGAKGPGGADPAQQGPGTAGARVRR